MQMLCTGCGKEGNEDDPLTTPLSCSSPPDAQPDGHKGAGEVELERGSMVGVTTPEPAEAPDGAAAVNNSLQNAPYLHLDQPDTPAEQDRFEMPAVDIATLGRCVIWFSCGAASTVAAKIALTERPDALVCYIDTGSEHEDTERYRADVARWLDRPIQVLRSPDYVDVDDVIERTRYIVGVHGARCTTELKIKVRRAFQQPDDVQVFGFDARPKEVKRANEFRENYPEVNLWTPLIDSGLDKSDCHQLVARAGIRQHAMYELGYKNANCIGCVKGSLGYWNKIRVDFPVVFARRAQQEREIGHAICSTEVRINGRRDKIPVFLDELEPGRGNYAAEIEHECGVFCAGVEAAWTDEQEACDV